MRFHYVDTDAWYDRQARLMWIIDDACAETADDWNQWFIYDDFAGLTGTYWWWGSWYPECFTWFSEAPCAGLEVAEEGQTRPLDPDDLLARIWAIHPTTFYRFYRSDEERGTHMLAYGIPDLSSSRRDNFPF